jgi:hypothetical protein
LRLARRAASAVLVAAPATTGSVANGADARPTSLQRSLSSMSWPLRASVLRVCTLTGAVDDWLAHGDWPYLGEIAQYCRNLRAVESWARVLGIIAPRDLRTSHGLLVRAYSAARDGCLQVRLSALATRDAIDRAFRTESDADQRPSNRATASARAEFRQFERKALRSFGRAVTAWRSAVLRGLKASGLPPPRWLGELG